MKVPVVIFDVASSRMVKEQLTQSGGAVIRFHKNRYRMLVRAESHVSGSLSHESPATSQASTALKSLPTRHHRIKASGATRNHQKGPKLFECVGPAVAGTGHNCRRQPTLRS